MKNGRKKHSSFILHPSSFIILLAGLLPAVQPLLLGYLPWQVDGLLHFHRLAQLERAVSGGLYFPRWLPDLGFGFGYPLFNYYGPLSYYLLLPLRLVGLTVGQAMLAGYALALLVLAVGAYLWARDWLGRPAALVAAMAAVYAPYTLYNVHHRGALAEAWGVAWLSLALWAVHRLIRRGGALSLVLTTLTVTALLLTHNVVALIGGLLLATYVIFLGLDSAGIRGLGDWLIKKSPNPLIPALLALGLAAFFWLPAFVEKEWVQIEQLTYTADFDYHNNFLSPAELFAPPRAADRDLVNPFIPTSLGWPQLALALLSWWPSRRRLAPAVRPARLSLTVISLGLTLMTLRVSEPIWDFLPLLRFIEFPSRFLGPASLTWAILAGLGAGRLFEAAGERRRTTDEGRKTKDDGGKPTGALSRFTFHVSRFTFHVSRFTLHLPLATCHLLLAVYALPWLFPHYYPAPAALTPLDLLHFEAATGALGTTSGGDYLPIWVEEPPPAETLWPLYEASSPDYVIPRLDTTTLPAGATISQAYYGLTTAELSLDSPADFQARFHWYYFPGWTAELDGRPLEVFPTGPHGLLAIAVPAGRHRLALTFGDTPLRRWANGLSLASLAAFVALAGWQVAGGGFQNQNPMGGRWPALANYRLPITIFLGVGLFALKTAYLDRVDNPFRYSRFDGRQVAGVDGPLQVDFGGQMVLMGYDLPAVTVAADEPLALTLYWRTRPPLTTEYSVAVHLVDDQGRRYGQADSQHPAGYPVTRWLADQYGRDAHHLTPWPGTPPGDYTLLMSVYDQASGRRLDVLDETGRSTGATYALGRVQVTRPAHWPAPPEVVTSPPLTADLGDGLRLLGLDALAGEVEVGYPLVFTLFWQATAAPTSDYQARLRLLAADGRVAAEAIFPPGRADYPTSTWSAGEIVRDGRGFLVPAVYRQQPVTAGRYHLWLDLLDETNRPLAAGVELGQVEVTIPPRRFERPGPEYPAAVSFGEVATLLGYNVNPASLAAGGTLELTLFWEALAPAGRSYTVFVHLVGADQAIYAQEDRIPAAGARPTTGWLPGEIIEDSFQLRVGADAPAGPYELRVGLYDPVSGERLLVAGGGGRALGSYFSLPTPIIVP